MDILSLIIFLTVGALAGWLAGNIMKGRGFGLIGNILVGIAGAVLGGFVFSLLNIITGGFLGSIIMSTIGAVVLLYIINIVKKA
ncbi:GlsB/YeaQ/YmgE family stress response membrane protein [bacterium]|nr:GlsB/YeaQ/YmgE family stress response membrane protein [bacterium]